MKCSQCGSTLLVERRYDPENPSVGVVNVCHNDACPLNIEAEKHVNRYTHIRILFRMILLGIEWSVIFWLVVQFVRWAVQ